MIQVKKNKIYNPSTLKKQWDPIFFAELTQKINKTKFMKFITAEPDRFHPYMVVEFYQKVVVAAESKSFRTNVYDTPASTSLPSPWRKCLD